MGRAKIYSGICGFTTEVVATSEDDRHVKLRVTSTCPDVVRLGKVLREEVFDAFEEIGPCKQLGRLYDTRIMGFCAKLPHVACPVPSGICKAMEVAAGLALPRDAHIEVLAEDKDDEASAKQEA